jgi:hypothetical protein
MSPKEKAGVLMFHFYSKISGISILNLPSNLITQMSGDSHFKTAKGCALLSVNEMADECNKYFEAISKNRVNYWVAVKAEIEKM